MKRQVVNVLKNYCFRTEFGRRTYLRLRALRNEGYRHALSIEAVADKLHAMSGRRILHGPFAGLRYTRHSSSYFPQMIVGSYECELHPVIEDVVRRAPDLIVEVGSAGGYYLIGLLARIPTARALGFEIDFDQRYACHKCADANGVSSRLRVENWCSPEALAGIDSQSVFLICDIEGAEWELLDPTISPELRRWDLLIEAHEGHRPGVTKLLSDRFGDSHQLQVISQQPRHADDWPGISELTDVEKGLALDEIRGEQSWLHFKTLSQ